MSTNLKRDVNNLNYIINKDDTYREKLWINEDWDNPKFRKFIRSFNQNWERGNTIYNVRNLLTKIPAKKENGIKKDIAVKKFRLTRKYDKFRFRLLDSKAVRSLRIALAFETLDINTPKPVALIEKRGKFNKLLYSYFITEYINYDYNLLDVVRDEDHPIRQEVSRFLPGIATDVRKMHENGIVHNDLHAGNILVKNIDDSPQFYYIDLNRGRIKKSLTVKVRMKDLARLKLKPEEREIFIKNYDPDNYKELLSLMTKQRERRKKFLYWKRKLKKIFKYK